MSEACGESGTADGGMGTTEIAILKDKKSPTPLAAPVWFPVSELCVGGWGGGGCTVYCLTCS